MPTRNPKSSVATTSEHLMTLDTGSNGRPALDPTPRTLEQMAQATNSLKELVLAKFAENDKAVKLLQDFTNRQPTPGEIYQELKALKELTATRFDERDRRFEVRHSDDRAMVEQALVSAKEATSKTEANFSEQIRTILDQMRVGQSSVEARITDIKERIDRGEGVGSGSKQSYGVIVTVIGLAFTATIVAVAVINVIMKG